MEASSDPDVGGDWGNVVMACAGTEPWWSLRTVNTAMPSCIRTIKSTASPVKKTWAKLGQKIGAQWGIFELGGGKDSRINGS